METISKAELEQLYRLTEKVNAVDNIYATMQVRTLNGNPHRIAHREVIILFQTIVHEMMQTK